MKQLVCIFTAISVLGGAFVSPLASRPDPDRADQQREETFTVDVALDSATLVVNHVDPTQPQTAQLRGDTLVIDGTIYPRGTLPSGIADNDPNAPGGIGKIRCRALVLVPLTDLTTPAATFVSELYSLPDDNQTILVDGPGANLYATVERAVLGGTRLFDGVSGQLSETNLGLNKSGACNLRVTFKLRNPSRHDRHDN
jgi:hypothetical protein